MSHQALIALVGPLLLTASALAKDPPTRVEKQPFRVEVKGQLIQVSLSAEVPRERQEKRFLIRVFPVHADRTTADPVWVAPPHWDWQIVFTNKTTREKAEKLSGQEVVGKGWLETGALYYGSNHLLSLRHVLHLESLAAVKKAR